MSQCIILGDNISYICHIFNVPINVKSPPRLPSYFLSKVFPDALKHPDLNHWVYQGGYTRLSRGIHLVQDGGYLGIAGGIRCVYQGDTQGIVGVYIIE